MGNTLTAQQRAAVLSAYAPYQPTVQVDHDDPDLRFTGTLQALVYHGAQVPHVALRVTDFGGANKVASVLDVRPVLYSLADVAHLPDDALPRLVHLLDIVASEDRGAGEYVRTVKVLSASPMQLHLRVSTGYTHPDTSYHNEADEFVEDEPQPDEEGCDYEVIIGGLGDIHWRCLPHEAGQREPFRLLGGAQVLLAVEWLRERQVAVGEVVHIGQERYVRRALPALEGGPPNG